MHGDLQQGSHHGDVGVVGRGQGHSQVLADLPGTLEEYLVELFIGKELWGEEVQTCIQLTNYYELGSEYIRINELFKNCVSVFYRYIAIFNCGCTVMHVEWVINRNFLRVRAAWKKLCNFQLYMQHFSVAKWAVEGKI